YHSASGFTSTARIFLWPRCCRTRTRWPPMKPPAPVTTTRSSLDITGLSIDARGVYLIFQRLATCTAMLPGIAAEEWSFARAQGQRQAGQLQQSDLSRFGRNFHFIPVT